VDDVRTAKQASSHERERSRQPQCDLEVEIVLISLEGGASLYDA
jgi:hypothetical protein